MPSPLVQEIGSEWRESPFHDLRWAPTQDERPGGEAEGFWVSHENLRGYLKPSKDGADVRSLPRAAHEKIAADLGFDLGLPVAPAMLVDGRVSGGKVEAAVVSLVLYKEVHKWANAVQTQASKAMAMHVLRTNRGAWSGMLAFDTWLANADRNNGGNVLIGIQPDDLSPLAEAMFCDFSYSMLHSGWAAGKWQEVSLAATLPEIR